MKWLHTIFFTQFVDIKFLSLNILCKFSLIFLSSFLGGKCLRTLEGRICHDQLRYSFLFLVFWLNNFHSWIFFSKLCISRSFSVNSRVNFLQKLLNNSWNREIEILHSLDYFNEKVSNKFFRKQKFYKKPNKKLLKISHLSLHTFLYYFSRENSLSFNLLSTTLIFLST